MKNISSFFLLGAVVLFASSCTVEKRKYMSGYHVEWKHRTEMAQAKPAEKLQLVAESTTVEAAVVTEYAAAPVPVAEVNAIPVQPVALIPTAKKQQAPAQVVAPVKSTTQAYAFNAKSRAAAPKTALMASSAALGVKKMSQISKLVLVIIALFIPPLAVYLSEGSWNGTCWLNLVLTLLFFIPGFIHALIVILG